MENNQTLPIKMKVLFTIVDYSLGEEVTEIYKKHRLPLHVLTHGHGSVSSELLDYLGLGEQKKIIIISIIPESKIKDIFDVLIKQMHFNKQGVGIAFTLPVSSISSFISNLCSKTNLQLKYESEENKMTQGYPYELILTIVTKGHFDHVMDVAKSVGATGGTLIHGRGLGSEEASKFLGITIQPEKDIILILVPRDKKQKVMETITREAGLSTDGKGICFSVPVDSALGLGEIPFKDSNA